MSERSVGSTVRYELRDRVGLLHFDDGKANALSFATISDLAAALDRARDDRVGALVLTGRPGRFCAGFDLSVMTAGIDEARRLVTAGAELLVRVFLNPAPVVLACSGHALAGGAVLLLAGDLCIGAGGEFKIGLNEVAIGMPLPAFAVELARARLSPLYFTEATALARVYDPEGALTAGYLHRVVRPEQLIDDALAHARLLADTLRPGAFVGTRQRARGALARRLLDGLGEDLSSFTLG